MRPLQPTVRAQCGSLQAVKGPETATGGLAGIRLPRWPCRPQGPWGRPPRPLSAACSRSTAAPALFVHTAQTWLPSALARQAGLLGRASLGHAAAGKRARPLERPPPGKSKHGMAALASPAALGRASRRAAMCTAASSGGGRSQPPSGGQGASPRAARPGRLQPAGRQTRVACLSGVHRWGGRALQHTPARGRCRHRRLLQRRCRLDCGAAAAAGADCTPDQACSRQQNTSQPAVQQAGACCTCWQQPAPRRPLPAAALHVC